MDDKSPVFYNKQLSTKKGRKVHSIIPRKLHFYGLRRVEDFYDVDGRLLKWRDLYRAGLPVNMILEWNAVRAMLARNKDRLTNVRGRARLQRLQYNKASRMEPQTLTINRTELRGEEITQKKTLKLVSQTKGKGKTPHQKRLEEKCDLSEEDWKHIYKLVKSHSIYSRRRSFLYIFYVVKSYTNSSYHRFKVKDSPECKYCNEPYQNFMHLFFECEEVKKLREKMNQEWNLSLPDTEKAKVLALGSEFEELDRVCIFLILEFNYYVYINNWEDKPLDLAGLRSQ